jgi:RNA polymerase sigma-70 factor, ECF subfamily
MIISDRDILKRYRQDNRKGIRAAFEKYYEDLCLFGVNITGDLPSAEDIVQTVFIKCWQENSFLSIKTSLKSYLYISVRNGCINHLKKQQAHRHIDLTDYALSDKLASNDEAEQLPDALVINELNKAIDKLPEKCREIFLLVVVQSKSYKEAASELGVSINTVKTQISRAMTKLRHSLYPHFNG